jgi:hypothetical protein
MVEPPFEGKVVSLREGVHLSTRSGQLRGTLIRWGVMAVVTAASPLVHPGAVFAVPPDPAGLASTLAGTSLRSVAASVDPAGDPGCMFWHLSEAVTSATSCSEIAVTDDPPQTYSGSCDFGKGLTCRYESHETIIQWYNKDGTEIGETEEDAPVDLGVVEQPPDRGRSWVVWVYASEVFGVAAIIAVRVAARRKRSTWPSFDGEET